jgi:para-nitrobenzyl esterase
MGGAIVDRRGVLAGAGLFAVSALPAWSQSAPTAETGAGRIQGYLNQGVKVFKGVRYGAPTGGANRFQPPRKPDPWGGVREATAYGASAVQMAPGPGPSISETPPGDGQPMGSEDCLFLNVWTPALDGARRPVMVWLHGGGFTTGSGSPVWLDGTNLARKHDVVVVTLNHRLNVFGYCGLQPLARARFADAGNAGMLDIVQALHWVRDNIERFGGDPRTVMIFGESGGGRKVSVMMAFEPAAGLFHRATVESGSALRVDRAEIAAQRAEKMMKVLGLAPSDLDRLVATPAFDLVRAAAAVQPEMNQFRPVVDGRALKRQSFDPDAPAISRHIPMMIGTNRTEASFGMGFIPGIENATDQMLSERAGRAVTPARAAEFIATYRRLYPSAKNDELIYMLQTDRTYFLDSTIQAARKADQGGAPAFMYNFYRETPIHGGRFHVPHTSEIPFVFDNLQVATNNAGPHTAETQALADKMSAAWASFARTGAPAAPGLPAWPKYDSSRRPTMVFDLQSKVVDDPRGEQRKLMAALGTQQLMDIEPPPM